jgi:hypothetical protein
MALWTNKDEEAGKPKYLSDADKANTYGADVAETAATAGVTAGWVLKTTGTGGRSGRVSYESLVAMGSMTTDGDSVLATQTRTITISGQPANVAAELGENEEVTFSVTASVSPASSSTLAYAWQFSEDTGSTWESDQPDWATGFATASITIADADVDLGVAAGDLNGYQFRCVVSTSGASDVVSDAATLTVA